MISSMARKIKFILHSYEISHLCDTNRLFCFCFLFFIHRNQKSQIIIIRYYMHTFCIAFCRFTKNESNESHSFLLKLVVSCVFCSNFAFEFSLSFLIDQNHLFTFHSLNLLSTNQSHMSYLSFLHLECTNDIEIAG